MPIKNYTTEIPPRKTASEVAQMLHDFGATMVGLVGHRQCPTAIKFELDYDGLQYLYEIPVNAEGVLECLKKDDVPRRFRSTEQAERVAWRLIKDYIATLLAFLESSGDDARQVFLGYMIARDDGTTAYQQLVESHERKLLEAHGE